MAAGLVTMYDVGHHFAWAAKTAACHSQPQKFYITEKVQFICCILKLNDFLRKAANARTTRVATYFNNL